MRAVQPSEGRVRTPPPRRRVADRWLAHCDDAGNVPVCEPEEAADYALVSEGEEMPGDARDKYSQAVAPPRRAPQRCGLTERDGQHQSREYGGTAGKRSFGALVPGQNRPWSPAAFTGSLTRGSARLRGRAWRRQRRPPCSKRRRLVAIGCPIATAHNGAGSLRIRFGSNYCTSYLAGSLTSSPVPIPWLSVPASRTHIILTSKIANGSYPTLCSSAEAKGG